MTWSKEDVAIKASRLLDGLVSVAMGDHIISDDEAEIIEKVRMRLWNMESEIAEMAELESDEFKTKMIQTLKEILSDIQHTAKEDGVITEEEKKLINRIRDYMTNEGLGSLL